MVLEFKIMWFKVKKLSQIMKILLKNDKYKNRAQKQKMYCFQINNVH
jgi:hypothetical protein